jgi:hypothetical protein
MTTWQGTRRPETPLNLREEPTARCCGAVMLRGLLTGRCARTLELAGVQPATARPIAPRRNRQQPATAQAQPLTLAALADAKRLDAEKLIAWHVRELPDGGIEILYLTREGELHAVQYRCALEGDNRFKWRKATRRFSMGCGDCPSGRRRHPLPVRGGKRYLDSVAR